MPPPASHAQTAPAGKRERNKLEKYRRIKASARQLFEEKGYQDATIRDIAKHAGVGLGTLFLYARDKRDLLFLLFEDELNEVTDRAFDTVKPDTPLVDQLVDAFRVFFDYFALSPRVSQDMMREVVFYVKSINEINSFHTGIARTHERLARFVARAQALDLVTTSYAPDDLARLIFSIYRMDVRSCFATEPLDVAAGLARLRHNLDILFIGIRPQAATPRPTRRGPELNRPEPQYSE
ncbi:MAG: helix-turn-helix domain-containing protein [Candidimonas sp.]|jgi:AcrR family transcriptional regulator